MYYAVEIIYFFPVLKPLSNWIIIVNIIQFTWLEVSSDVHAAGNEDQGVALVAAEADGLHTLLPGRGRLFDPGDSLIVTLLDFLGLFVQQSNGCKMKFYFLWWIIVAIIFPILLRLLKQITSFGSPPSQVVGDHPWLRFVDQLRQIFDVLKAVDDNLLVVVDDNLLD